MAKKDTHSNKGLKKWNRIAIIGTMIILMGIYILNKMCTFRVEHVDRETPKEFKNLYQGMKKEEVKNILGEPLKICIRKEDEKATHCKYNGYPASFAIADEAFVYEHKGTKNTVVYIYFGKSGRVSGWQYLGK